MKLQELEKVAAPFTVVSVHDGHTATVIGFSERDPLDEGGLVPPLATAYFKGGGWLLVSDLLRNFNLPPHATTQPTGTASGLS